MRFVVTYENANKEQKIRLFKTLVDTREFVKRLRTLGLLNFEIKIIKPY